MDLPLYHRAVTYGSVTYATVGSASNRAVAALRAFPGFARLLLAVARRRCGRERAEEPGGGLGHVVHRPIERRLVGPRRTGGPAQLPDELQGRGPDLLLGGRRVEVGEGPDVPAHVRAPVTLDPRGYRAGQDSQPSAVSTDTQVSWPPPPWPVSASGPPLSWSSPAPPHRTSRPFSAVPMTPSPYSTSFPPPPVSVSLPPPPMIMSPSPPPEMRSLPSSP